MEIYIKTQGKVFDCTGPLNFNHLFALTSTCFHHTVPLVYIIICLHALISILLASIMGFYMFANLRTTEAQCSPGMAQGRYDNLDTAQPYQIVLLVSLNKYIYIFLKVVACLLILTFVPPRLFSMESSPYFF